MSYAKLQHSYSHAWAKWVCPRVLMQNRLQPSYAGQRGGEREREIGPKAQGHADIEFGHIIHQI